ncbi:uncharacterized protein [Ptychodera flava]|uniref:uncharacterized protein isoform X2 n=1 Tax=Ptychodera flava TaxID=63121 RepID=UPI003969C6A4
MESTTSTPYLKQRASWHRASSQWASWYRPSWNWASWFWAGWKKCELTVIRVQFFGEWTTNQQDPGQLDLTNTSTSSALPACGVISTSELWEVEKAAKKKLQAFLNEMLRIGTVRGFKYFVMYMRGREEMICRVQNEPLTPSESEQSTPVKFSFSGSLNAANMPFDDLSGFGHIDVGLPPASPVEREIVPSDDNSTLFLVAGYARYGCPYVWVRSNHERLVKLSGDDSFTKDSPLKIKSTTTWLEKDTKIWDIIAELVKIATLPSPRNPFAVDMEYFDQLPFMERILATGAMVNFLQKVLDYHPDKPYIGLVSEDLAEVTKKHFKELQTYVQQQAEQIQTETETQQHKVKHHHKPQQQQQPQPQQQQEQQQQQNPQEMQKPEPQSEATQMPYNQYKSSGGLTRRAHAQYY